MKISPNDLKLLRYLTYSDLVPDFSKMIETGNPENFRAAYQGTVGQSAMSLGGGIFVLNPPFIIGIYGFLLTNTV